MTSAEYNDNAVTGGGAVNNPLPISMLMVSFIALAWYNCIELTIVMFSTFRRYQGLYFWSLLVSTWGIVLYSLSFVLKYYQLWDSIYVIVAGIVIGWCAMVTGQSLVLWSRLHLVVRDNQKIRWILIMIIVDAILFHIPTTVLIFGSNSPQSRKFAHPYMVMERIQITAFSIQEFIISAVYVWETYKLLQPSEYFQRKKIRRVMTHLIYIHILIIIMDITLLCTQYTGHYAVQTTYKGALYSIKLKLEFAILNRLMDIAQPHRSTDHSSSDHVQSSAGRTNGIPLYKLNKKNGKEPHTRTAGQGYSVTAGYQSRGSKIQDNCVMMTTEVEVVSSARQGDVDGEVSREEQWDVKKAQDDDCSSDLGVMRISGSRLVGKGSGRKAGHSPSSSELEFAGAGC